MKNNNILKNFICFSLGNYISIIIGLILIPITTKILSPEQYGIASFLELTMNILVLISYLGMDQGFMRYFYEEEKKLRNGLLYNCLLYPVSILFIIEILLYFFRNRVLNILILKDTTTYVVLGIGLIFYFLNRFSLLVIRMKQKNMIYSMFNIINQIIKFILIILFYNYYGNNYKIIFFSVVLATSIISILAILSEKNMWKINFRTSFKRREILEYSFPLSITVILIWIFQSSDKIMIQYYSNSYEVGLYSVAFKIIAIINILQQNFSIFWAPVAYEQYNKNKEDFLFFEKVFEVVTFVAIKVGIIILIFKDFIIYFLGNMYKEVNNIFPCLIFIPIMYTLSEITVLGLTFKKKTRIIFFLTLAVTLFNIVGNTFLIPKFGAKGAAISTGITYIVFFTLRTYFGKKYINIRIKLKRLYVSIVLLLIYTIYLSFYKNAFTSIIFGFFLLIFVDIIFYDILKQIIKLAINIIKNKLLREK